MDAQTCANGNPSPVMPGYDGPDHCPACHADVEAAVAQFNADVAAGIYDTQGYTPAERRAQQRKATQTMTTAATMTPTDPQALATRELERISADRFEALGLSQLIESGHNPRKHFDVQKLQELAASIGEKGIVEPLVVRPIAGRKASPDRFEIVAGARRYRGAQLAGLTHVPCIIREYSDEDVLELTLIENLQRDDLDPLEQAAGFRALIDRNPDKHSALSIATRIGMSPAWVWDRMKLLDLVPEAKALLTSDRISVGHAIPLARLKPADQARLIKAERQNGYGATRSGLWQYDGGSLDLDEEDAPAGKGQEDPYADLKPVSVRELETWIRDHIRFDAAHMAKAQPLVFEATAATIAQAAAQPGRGKKLIAITHSYRVSDDARDESERTYGADSWKRADGQANSKTCEHAVLGVVVAGEGYGDTFQVCVARDKCRVHFADVVRAKEKAAKLREGGKGTQAAKVEKKAEQSYAAKQQQRDAERKQRERAWQTVESQIRAALVAEAKGIKTLTQRLAEALARDHIRFDVPLCKKHLGATWFKSPVQALMLSAIATFHFASYLDHDWWGQLTNDVITPYGLNVGPFQAIRKAHETAAATPAAGATKAGKKAKRAAA